MAKRKERTPCLLTMVGLDAVLREQRKGEEMFAQRFDVFNDCSVVG